MIARIGTALAEILRQNLSDILPKTGQIGVYLPQDRGEIALGLYLYSVRNCAEVNSPALSSIGRNIKAVPPRFLTLYYLLTAYSNAELPFRALDEHRLLMRAMEVFEKTPVLNERNLGFKPGVWVNDLCLEFVDFDAMEMARAWETQQVPYRLSVIYKVCPIELSTETGRISRRVGEISTSAQDKA